MRQVFRAIGCIEDEWQMIFGGVIKQVFNGRNFSEVAVLKTVRVLLKIKYLDIS